jgi:prepilin-type N-terminal cleavage/methylation domain-containing protein/prepilin-type processing-associated H-X9-DG protein
MTRNFSRGFTLLELLIVIAVIAILATIAFPVILGIQEHAKATKDMNNLRQIGIATQLYMNDNDGALPGSTTVTWMSQLHPKYLSSWNIFQSPFDIRGPSELGDATTPVSYGINGNVYPNNIAMSADKISKPTIFILFAPAQDSAPTVVEFQGTAITAAPGVTVLGNGATATSTPGGTTAAPPPPSGTHSNRTRINALFADLHLENMTWPGSAAAVSTTFTNNAAALPADPDGYFRWTPYTPYP